VTTIAVAVTGSTVTSESLVVILAQIGGLATAATVLALVAAFLFRWYANQRAPTGITMLVGLTAVAVYLNTRSALGNAISGAAALSSTGVLFNVVAFAVAGFGSAVGARIGDRLAVSLVLERDPVGGGLDRVVRAVGRVIVVELPEEVEDMVGYDSVPEATKSSIAGETFLFPRRLTVAELRDRIVARLKADYDVGHVDLEVDEEGTVQYLGVGQRVAGIGPTLPRETVALAIRADPAHAAASGDAVQVWSREDPEWLCNAEIRGTCGEVVTLAVDTVDAPKLDPDERYRLVTLSTDARPDREFISLLRAADESLALIEVGDGSPLVGTPLSDLGVSVVAVLPGGDERVQPLPEPDRVLAGSEAIYVLASPDALRRIEGRAGASVVTQTGGRRPDAVSSVE
jgi:hypothetical protein